MLHRGFDLDAHGVARIIKPRRLSIRVLADPVLADDGHHHVTADNRLLDPVVVVDPGRNAVDVEEHGVLAELRNQIIGNAAGHVLGVGAAV